MVISLDLELDLLHIELDLIFTCLFFDIRRNSIPRYKS